MYLIQAKKIAPPKSHRYILHYIKHIVIWYRAQAHGKVIGKCLYCGRKI